MRARYLSSLALLALLALLATPAAAAAAGFPAGKDVRIGADFLQTCGSPLVRPDWDSMCTGYVVGLENAFNIASWADPRLRLCTDTVTYGEMRETLVQFLRANPEALGDPTAMTFWAAIAQAFPCGTEPQSHEQLEPAPQRQSEYRF